MKNIFMKKKVIKLLTLTIVSSMLLNACGINSNNDEHRLIVVESYTGDIKLERDEKSEDVYESMHLLNKDIVTTGSDSEILLLADSDKHILAKENTSFELEANGTEDNGKIKINLVYGEGLFTIDNKLPDDSEFLVETPNASLAVRGTVFYVAYDESLATTKTAVIEGKVYIKNEDFEETLEAGDFAIIDENGISVTEDAFDVSDIDRDDSKEILSLVASQNGGDGDGNNMQGIPLIFKAGDEYEHLSILPRQYTIEYTEDNKLSKTWYPVTYNSNGVRMNIVDVDNCYYEATSDLLLVAHLENFYVSNSISAALPQVDYAGFYIFPSGEAGTVTVCFASDDNNIESSVYEYDDYGILTRAYDEYCINGYSEMRLEIVIDPSYSIDLDESGRVIYMNALYNVYEYTNNERTNRKQQYNFINNYTYEETKDTFHRQIDISVDRRIIEINNGESNERDCENAEYSIYYKTY